MDALAIRDLPTHLASDGLAAARIAGGWMALGRARVKARLLALPGADAAELGPTAGRLSDLRDLLPAEGLRAERLLARLLPGPLAIRWGAHGPRVRRPTHPAWDALVGMGEPILLLPFTGEPPADLPRLPGDDGGAREARVTIAAGTALVIDDAGAIGEARLRDAARVHLLAVCSGNTCRSPMFEALLRGEVARLRLQDVHVESAGTFAGDGHPASAHAVTAMLARELDLVRHRSRPVDELELGLYDRIYGMTAAHLAFLRHLGVPADRLAPVTEGGVGDPYGGDLAAYEACANDLAAAATRLAEGL